MAKRASSTKTAAPAEVGAASTAVDQTAAIPAVVPAETAASVTPKGAATEREVRWDAFLVKAREVNPERFDRQKQNGEFDTIPDSFV